MRFLQISLDGKTFLIAAPARVVEQYEFRSVPGTLVKGMHLGKPLLDLGVLTKTRPASMAKGFIYDDFGFIAEEITGEIEIEDEKIKVFPRMVWEQRGAVVKGTVEIDGQKIPLLNDKLNRHWKEDIETELKARRWL